MKAIAIYESLTGTTARTARRAAALLTSSGVPTVACPITTIDFRTLAEADLVLVGSWTDGFVFIGQKPGRAARLRKLPAMAGKKAVVFCTYAVDPGATLDKLATIVRDCGADVLGGMAVHRLHVERDVQDLVGRVLDVLAEDGAVKS